jgi:phosphoribosylglycinamide formyltransferase-1
MSEQSAPYKPRPFPVRTGPLRLAVCISGGGSTLANLSKKIDEGVLGDARIVLVVSDRPGVKGLEIAAAHGIRTLVVPRKDQHMSRSIFEAIRAAETDLVVLGGFLSLLFVPDDYENRVINIHPALIPAFCGRGYYGRAVHQAAIESGVKFSGCTVHFADRSYDTGPIILQRVVPVQDDDTADSLAARVFEVECEALPEAIRLVSQNLLERRGRRMLLKTVAPN